MGGGSGGAKRLTHDTTAPILIVFVRFVATIRMCNLGRIFWCDEEEKWRVEWFLLYE